MNNKSVISRPETGLPSPTNPLRQLNERDRWVADCIRSIAAQCLNWQSRLGDYQFLELLLLAAYLTSTFRQRSALEKSLSERDHEL